MKRVSLRFRLMVMVMLITVSAFIVVGATNYSDAKRSILGSLHDNAATKVQNRAENLSEWMQTRLAMVEVMSRTERVRFGTDEEKMAYFQKEAERSNGVFGSIGFADLNGRLPLSSGETIYIADEPTFKKVLQGNYEISEPFRGQLPDKWLFTVQVPVYGSNNAIIGLVNAAILMETTIHLNLDFKIGQASSIFLFNEEGERAYPPGISPALQGISNEFLRNDHGSIEVVDNGSKAIVFYATVPKASWHIGLEVPLEEFEAPLNALFRKTVITIVLAIAVMVGLMVMLLNREITRIRQLVAVTKTVAAGNFNVPTIEFSNKDELGSLAYSINVMIYKLRDMFQRFEVMINQNGFAMMSLDEHYVINYFSKAAEELLGYTNKEVVGQATPLRFIPLDELERVAADLSIQLGKKIAPDLSVFKELRNMHNSYDIEWTFIRKDGSRITVLHNSNGVRNLDGELTGVVVVTRDITQQKKVQVELLQAKQEAEEANLAKGEYVAFISHEIRTPLSGVIGLAQLMQKTSLTDIQRDYLNKMLDSSRSMLTIINEILDFSKVEAGKLELERISFSPENLLNKVADMLGVFLIEKDRFDFIVEVSDSIPGALIGDPYRLEQILLNLCSNAIKFTESGHVMLKVEGREWNGTELGVRFSVEDTGIGISQMQIDRLFTPYSQGDDSTSRKYGGTGLGLFISKSLIEMMDGTLEVESEEGKGSRFFFTVPLEVPPLSGNEKLLMKEQIRHHAVWLVEDSLTMRTHLTRIISSFGMRPAGFEAWKEAMRSLTEGGAPEGTVILLDMEAPDMFGPETYVELKQAAVKKGVFTVAMTSAHGREELNRMPSSMKPDGILIKPISRINLHLTLLSILNRKKAMNCLKSLSETHVQVIAKTEKGKILLAEDHEINRQVAIALLESHGFEVKVALNGKQVLAMLEVEKDWDLVLMDIQMPEMDGKETTRRIRQNPQFAKLPIIAMTAYTLPKEKEAFLEMGMNDILTKPIEEGPLLETISSWIILENLKGIQVWEALTRLNGKVTIFMQMLQTFKRDFFDYDEKIQQAYEKGKLKEMKQLLHSLRGAAGTLAAGDLYRAVGNLEDILDTDLVKLSEEKYLLLDKVSRSLREVISSLDSLD